jgi:hypothetical protein
VVTATRSMPLWPTLRTQVGHLPKSESARSGREQMQGRAASLFDHLVGNGENSQRNCQGEHVRNREEIEITNSNVVGRGSQRVRTVLLQGRKRASIHISSDLIRPGFGANA